MTPTGSGRSPRPLAVGLSAGIVVGAIVGLVVGWIKSRAGFEYTAALGLATWLESVAAWGAWGLLAGGLTWVGERLLGWRSSQAVRLAASLGVLPGLAAGGYALNRWLGIRPSQLLQGHAWLPNLGIVVAALACALVLAALSMRIGPKLAMRLLVSAVLLVVLLGLGRAWFFRGGQEKARSDVLVLLVDALRADHVGAHGHSRDTTPSLDRLAADGVRFDQAVAASTFTKSSIASLFTGRYPYQHGVYWGAWEDEEGRVHADRLPEAETTLAEIFRERGYLTEAWVQNGHLRRTFGFGQGFVHYRDQQGHALRINRQFRRFLRGAGQRYPFFAYLHYIDLHDPYLPPASFRERFGDPGDPYRGVDLEDWGAYLEAVRRGEMVPTAEQLRGFELLYDAQLAAVDAEIGVLLEDLEASGRYDDMVILVTADHGDAFGEHGVISHSTAPYDELVRVPWIVKLPGQRFAGRVIESQVSLVDVLETLADTVGLAGVPETAGCSRWPEIRGVAREPGSCEMAVVEIAEEEGEEATLGLRTSSHKYLRRHGGSEELFDLAADPEERYDRVSDPALASVLEVFRHRARQVLAGRHQAADRIEVDPSTLEELQALGYVGSRKDHD